MRLLLKAIKNYFASSISMCQKVNRQALVVRWPFFD